MKHTGLKGYARYVAMYHDMERKLAMEGLSPEQTIMDEIEWKTTVDAYKNTYKEAGVRLRDATAQLIDEASYPISYREAKGLREAIKAAGLEGEPDLPSKETSLRELRRGDIKVDRALLMKYPELSDLIRNTYHELASSMGASGASRAISNRFFGGSP